MCIYLRQIDEAKSLQMYNNSNTEEQSEGKKILETLKRHHGSLTELAKRMEMSRDYVRRCLEGTHENADVVLRGAELALELEEAKEEKIKRARAILEQIYNITL